MKHFGLKSLLAGAAVLALTASASLAEVVFNRGNSADPESLDPHKTATVYEANILRDLFMGLMIHNAKAELAPGAAESYTMSADGKVYTFKMRAGAKWSDGSPVTAHDYVYSWQRLVNKDTAAEYAYMLAPVVNAEAITKGAKKPEESSGWTCPDCGTKDILSRFCPNCGADMRESEERE